MRSPIETRRSDLVHDAAALRGDWPIPADVRSKMLQRAVNICYPDYIDPDLPPDPDDPEHKPRPAPKRSDRIVLAAMKVLGAFNRSSIEQQRVDLMRERLHGDGMDDQDTRLALLGVAEEAVKAKANAK